MTIRSAQSGPQNSNVSAVLAEITQGQRIWRRQAPRIGAQLVVYPHRREMARHSHRTANITVLLAGSFEEEIDGHDHICGPLSVVVKPAGAVHATYVGVEGTHSLVVEIEEHLEDELRRRFGLFDECRWYHEPGEIAPAVLGLCCGLRQSVPMADWEMAEWLARLGRAVLAAPRHEGSRPHGLHVRKALEMMHRERRLSTGELAARLGLHPVYLARLFRYRLGCSPAQMRQRLRIGAAMDQIVKTEHPLASVALDAGFADQSHLARQVKRHVGVAPGALRRLSRQKHDPKDEPVERED